MHIISMFGPSSFFISHNDGYFVIYSLPDGNTFVAHLDGNYEILGSTRFLGHQSMLATLPYNREFTLDELFAPDLGATCEMHIHQQSSSS